jgi:ABC-2 type transport system permease protein
MNHMLILGERAVREAKRTPDAILPTLLIPIFFLLVNTGQAAKIFPTGSTPFLEGQSYAAFQLPATVLLAASFGVAALYLVEEIENGYFDKLRATPISRGSIALGRLSAEGLKAALMTTVIVLIALPFGIEVASGPIGFVILVALAVLWAIGYSGFLQFVALKTRNAAATNSAGFIFFPLLFLTPNFVPRELLTRPMEIAATFNPVTYVMEAMRSLILTELDWAAIAAGAAVSVLFASGMVLLNVRTMSRFD